MLLGQTKRVWAMTLMSLIRYPQVLAYFDVIYRCGHQIKVCPAVAFPCCLEKRSETRTRRIQCARCNVGKLSCYLLFSIGRCCLLCGCERTDTNDTEGRNRAFQRPGYLDDLFNWHWLSILSRSTVFLWWVRKKLELLHRIAECCLGWPVTDLHLCLCCLTKRFHRAPVVKSVSLVVYYASHSACAKGRCPNCPPPIL
jgi:hypothetical protein